MKILKTLLGNVIILCVAILCLNAVDTTAQPVPIEEITTHKYALANLIQGIKSKNCGVKRSAIYFAGKYRIKDAKDILLDQLKNEKEACTRILIALVLYEMGDSNGLLSARDLIKADDDDKLGRMTTQIYYDYLKNDN